MLVTLSDAVVMVLEQDCSWSGPVIWLTGFLTETDSGLHAHNRPPEVGQLDSQQEILSLETLLPGGVVVLGAAIDCIPGDGRNRLLECVVLVTGRDTFVVVLRQAEPKFPVFLATAVSAPTSDQRGNENKLDPITPRVDHPPIPNLLVRTCVTFPLHFPCADQQADVERIRGYLQTMHFVARCDQKHILSTEHPNAKIQSVLLQLGHPAIDTSRRKKKSTSSTPIVSLELDALINLRDTSRDACDAPTLTISSAEQATLLIHLDVIAYASAHHSLGAVASTLGSALRHQFAGAVRLALSCQADIAAHHYSLPGHSHLFSVLSLSNAVLHPSAAVAMRRELHNRLLLPLDRPLLLPFQSVVHPRGGDMSEITGSVLADVAFACFVTDVENIFRVSWTITGHLRDVHLQLSTESRTGGQTYLIQGSYDYYHYLHGGIDDRGWGCAYRSMQTLCSWLHLQGYTESPPPTLKDIQALLVRMGDKDPTFIGSRNWIGAVEISMCLQNLFSVDCQILHVTSGCDIVRNSSQLCNHFRGQGSPIMIGGGVLAYTLLGIDWNEETGNVRYLILDPHYTGSDDLKEIKRGGWCGWKGPDLFLKGHFYNLCMPRRPRRI